MSKGKCQFYKLLVEYYVSEMMIQRVVNGKLPFFFSNNFLTKTVDIKKAYRMYSNVMPSFLYYQKSKLSFIFWSAEIHYSLWNYSLFKYPFTFQVLREGEYNL